MNRRTTYSCSPGCIVLLMILLICVGICVGIGYEFARWLVS